MPKTFKTTDAMNEAILSLAVEGHDRSTSPIEVLDNDAERCAMRFDSIQIHFPASPRMMGRVVYSWRGVALLVLDDTGMAPGDILNLSGIDGRITVTLD